MNITLLAVFEALLITIALSLDTFVSGFAYGANKIKIPFLSLMIINIICSIILGISLFLGAILSPYLNKGLALGISFTLLFIIGLIKLFESLLKMLAHKNRDLNKQVTFKIFSFKFVLNIYSNPTEADLNNNKVLSAGEATALAFALSIDGLAVGFGAGLTADNYLLISAVSLLVGALLMSLGCIIGKKVAQKIKVSLSWLSGLLLIGLAVSKFFT